MTLHLFWLSFLSDDGDQTIFSVELLFLAGQILERLESWKSKKPQINYYNGLTVNEFHGTDKSCLTRIQKSN